MYDVLRFFGRTPSQFFSEARPLLGPVGPDGGGLLRGGQPRAEAEAAAAGGLGAAEESALPGRPRPGAAHRCPFDR